MDPKYDKPPVRTTKGGVHYVRPDDILNSRVGREQIRRMADLDVLNRQAKPKTSKSSERARSA